MHMKTKKVPAFILTALISLAALVHTPTAMAASTDRVTWQGKEWYVHGVNMPWVSWGCDFGSDCSWSAGVKSSSVQNQIRPKFQQLKDANTHIVRWWLFPGEPRKNENNVMIMTDANNNPTGIHQGVYDDIDAALVLAEEYDLYYNFTIFSGPAAIPQDWINDASKRQKLATVLGTLFAKYKDHPRIISWESFNEPEWDLWNNKANTENTKDLVRKILVAQRSNTNALTSIGPATIQMDMWTGFDFDFISPHWYDPMASYWDARQTTAAQLQQQYNLDIPIVLGEIYAGSDINPLQRYEDLRTKGYAGSWGWSLFAENTQDKMQIDMTALSTFGKKYADNGPKRGGTVGVTPTNVPSTAPTATRVPTKAPSNAPTQVPSKAPTATPAISGVPITENYRSSAMAEPSIVSPGNKTTITADVTSKNASTVLIDIEVYSATGAKVHQAYVTNQTFSEQQRKRITTEWAVPSTLAEGQYIIKVGVFSNDWSQLYNWNNTAGTVQIKKTVGPTSQPTPTKALTVTPTRIPSPAKTATPTVSQRQILVYAFGYPSNGVYPTMVISINGLKVKTVLNVRDDLVTPVSYMHTSDLKPGDKIRVAFTNDYNGGVNNDRNLKIDKMMVQGITYQSEDPAVYSVGSYNGTKGCKTGYALAEQLNCNGYFEYILR